MHRNDVRGSFLSHARLTLLGIAMLAGVIAAPLAKALTLPEGFSATELATGLSAPTAMAFAPDGRLFVAEQSGRLRVIKNAALLPTPFLTLTVNASGERGLLGIAFDPNFATNQFLYLYYTATAPAIHNRVSRFKANGDVADSSTGETIILELDNLSTATNHNGGAMHFGPDGKLYIAVGENATSTHSQTLGNLLGKMLRINADGSIPNDNPFYSTASGINRAIWARGLRNPFTFAFQPGSARMFINDVGENTYEEINNGAPGANYGWPNSEGPTTVTGHTGPLHWYGHGLGCAITGGAFYPHGSPFPSIYHGSYFFADFCGDWIRRIDADNPAAATEFASAVAAPVDLKVGADGALYVLAREAGSVIRIDYAEATAPTISQQPANATVGVGQSASFSVSASGSQPLDYQWQRNGVAIGGATASTYTTPPLTAADSGARFRSVVSNSFGSITSNEATLTVTPERAPTAQITSPSVGALYRAGDSIVYAGTGDDFEDGALPASAFTWQVDFHHADHVHPFIGARTGATGGSFVIPTTGETAANVFYRIILTVRDSGGSSHTTFRDVLPRTSTVTVTTNPTGLQMTLDGQPFVSPQSFVGVEGIVRSIGVPSPQSLNGSNYTFRSWFDGGSATHSITTPIADTTYRANFKKGGRR